MRAAAAGKIRKRDYLKIGNEFMDMIYGDIAQTPNLFKYHFYFYLYLILCPDTRSPSINCSCMHQNFAAGQFHK